MTIAACVRNFVTVCWKQLQAATVYNKQLQSYVHRRLDTICRRLLVERSKLNEPVWQEVGWSAVCVKSCLVVTVRRQWPSTAASAEARRTGGRWSRDSRPLSAALQSHRTPRRHTAIFVINLNVGTAGRVVNLLIKSKIIEIIRKIFDRDCSWQFQHTLALIL